MKTRKLLFSGLLSIFAMTFFSCSENISGAEEMLSTANDEKSLEANMLYCDSCTYTGELSEAEITGLMEMREEEKLAHDVYQYFYEKYNSAIFNNISKSEEAHTNAVLQIINGYGLDDLAIPETGVYSDEFFNELFTTLTSDGSENLVEALQVGAYIEEYDINDLQNLLEETQNEDVVRVYTNLLQGSESHLRAFTRMAEQMGISYNPVIISEERYSEILSGENSFGNGSKDGYGNGRMNGKNN